MTLDEAKATLQKFEYVPGGVDKRGQRFNTSDRPDGTPRPPDEAKAIKEACNVVHQAEQVERHRASGKTLPRALRSQAR